jgi:hypothetical protein
MASRRVGTGPCGHFTPVPCFTIALEDAPERRWDGVVAGYAHLFPGLLQRIEQEFVAPLLVGLPWKAGYFLYAGAL